MTHLQKTWPQTQIYILCSLATVIVCGSESAPLRDHQYLSQLPPRGGQTCNSNKTCINSVLSVIKSTVLKSDLTLCAANFTTQLDLHKNITKHISAELTPVLKFRFLFLKIIAMHFKYL